MLHVARFVFAWYLRHARQRAASCSKIGVFHRSQPRYTFPCMCLCVCSQVKYANIFDFSSLLLFCPCYWLIFCRTKCFVALSTYAITTMLPLQSILRRRGGCCLTGAKRVQRTTAAGRSNCCRIGVCVAADQSMPIMHAQSTMRATSSCCLLGSWRACELNACACATLIREIRKNALNR